MFDPVIAIAGREWPVPALAPRQNRYVIPLLASLPSNIAFNYAAAADIVFLALTRGHPDLKRADFDEWPLPAWELADAIPVVANQTGMMTGVAQASGSSSELPDWDRIIAQFCNFLPGTTPDYWEDALTMTRLRAMREEWRLRPPAALLIAGFLKYKPRPRDIDAVEELMKLFPGGQLRLN